MTRIEPMNVSLTKGLGANRQLSYISQISNFQRHKTKTREHSSAREAAKPH